MSSRPTSSLFENLPDHASEHDDRKLAIDKVGIKSLSYPVQVLDKQNQTQHTVAEVDLYVSLPEHFKGTHMSRFVEILNARRGEMTIRNMPQILTEMQHRLEAEDTHLEMSFPYFLSKRAPISGVESLMRYDCAFRASKRGEEVDFVLRVDVPVKSLCPCSKSISKYGAHNQRSIVSVEVRASEFVWIEDVIERVESCASAPLYALLKREDEKYITELAYENPRFVEDLVREVVLSVRELDGVSWIQVDAENFESIHNHSAFARLEWSLEEEQARRQTHIDFPAPESSEESLPSFGQWLRQQRTARGFNQQELAVHLDISASYLSRVESDEKTLSMNALQRLAQQLGLDAVDVQLRAGQIPIEMLQRIQADPNAFRRWASS
jgi:GTP cyclohydrolase I